MFQFLIANESPLTPDLDLLFERHHAFCHADTPPESIHMMNRHQLAEQMAVFLVMRQNGQPIGMGALKWLAGAAIELKSMHIIDEFRGQGAARTMLDALIEAARSEGAEKIFLETGAQPSFAPARGLYRRAGFTDCPPFLGYTEDPMSTFLVLDLLQLA